MSDKFIDRKLDDEKFEWMIGIDLVNRMRPSVTGMHMMNLKHLYMDNRFM